MVPDMAGRVNKMKTFTNICIFLVLALIVVVFVGMALVGASVSLANIIPSLALLWVAYMFIKMIPCLCEWK